MSISRTCHRSCPAALCAGLPLHADGAEERCPPWSPPTWSGAWPGSCALLDAYDPGRLGRAVDVRTTALDPSQQRGSTTIPAPTHPTHSQPTQPTQQPPTWQPPPPEWGQATNPIPPPRPKRRRRRTILVAVGVGLALLIVGAVAGGGDPSPASAPASKTATPAPEPEADRPTTLKVGEVGTTVDVLDHPTAEVLVGGVREARDDFGLVDGSWVVAEVEVTALRDNVSTPDFYVLDAKGQKFTRPIWPPTAPVCLT